MAKAVWFPDEEQARQTRLYRLMQRFGISDYDRFYERSIQNVSWFWEAVVQDLELEWIRPYRQVMDASDGIQWTRWFVDGCFNVSHNCLDRWVNRNESRHRLALVWEGDDGAVRKYTYRDLWFEVNRLARGLSQLGIQKGDRVGIYLPMIPENVVAMLAIARIGAIFTPCFSGYGAQAVASRLNDCGAKLLITADGFLRRGKVVPMKEEADRAVDLSPSVKKVLVVRRLKRDVPWNEERDIEWDHLMTEMKPFSPEATASEDPFMIIYTSGTTGKPKGTVHVHTGFPIKAAFDAGYGMDVGPGDILFWVTDMGWMMGPWMVFGALMMGAAMLLFEGTPDYPEPDRLWRIVASHGVSHLGISPTVIRALMKHDVSWVKRHDLSSLRVFGSTGEPWNPEPWQWLFEQVGGGRVPIFNYSGGTEISGGILGGNLLKPIAPCSFSGPMPGMDADVWNENGQTVRGEVGELVLRQPWVGMTKGFWNDPQRYEETYWSRWPKTWVHGDWVEVDEEGFWYITGRSDDTLKIAGKRMGPAEMESVLVDHPAVVESATVGVPDETKGEQAVCFAVLAPGYEPGEELESDLIRLVEEKMGKALRPKRVHFVQELPKTRNGKILRRVIRAAYLGNEAGDLSSLENPDAVAAIRSLGTAEANRV
ncbi:AMP-dependent synthetase [Polycladomyces abyssicola]|uniref:acetate--CoA ligase n=1 Tax=Polycladomyces abyssicola TaxID=1125966 RepID=A0A8D5UCJ4_9BACL|nr:AMP-binding protein [Polycladomyces abyssicola]BCU80742.1 AMP-dependent synthetase [Polycladomyces abyssicola]